jgi:hypothetical protein
MQARASVERTLYIAMLHSHNAIKPTLIETLFKHFMEEMYYSAQREYLTQLVGEHKSDDAELELLNNHPEQVAKSANDYFFNNIPLRYKALVEPNKSKIQGNFGLCAARDLHYDNKMIAINDFVEKFMPGESYNNHKELVQKYKKYLKIADLAPESYAEISTLELAHSKCVREVDANWLALSKEKITIVSADGVSVTLENKSYAQKLFKNHQGFIKIDYPESSVIHLAYSFANAVGLEKIAKDAVIELLAEQLKLIFNENTDVFTQITANVECNLTASGSDQFELGNNIIIGALTKACTNPQIKFSKAEYNHLKTVIDDNGATIPVCFYFSGSGATNGGVEYAKANNVKTHDKVSKTRVTPLVSTRNASPSLNMSMVSPLSLSRSFSQTRSHSAASSGSMTPLASTPTSLSLSRSDLTLMSPLHALPPSYSFNMALAGNELSSTINLSTSSPAPTPHASPDEVFLAQVLLPRVGSEATLTREMSDLSIISIQEESPPPPAVSNAPATPINKPKPTPLGGFSKSPSLNALQNNSSPLSSPSPSPSRSPLTPLRIGSLKLTPNSKFKTSPPRADLTNSPPLVSVELQENSSFKGVRVLFAGIDKISLQEHKSKADESHLGFNPKK